ncbi:MAG: isoprenyl transferase [Legionellales bacterium]|nr:isoprenyl transferase [Legionellales bacterium]
MPNVVPQHVAIVMDGNGRWALQRNLPRIAGHKAGVQSVRSILQRAVQLAIPVLSLFAFGQENWRRPPDEVNFLMNLFRLSLKREIKSLHKNNIKLRILGDRSRFSPSLLKVIEDCEEKTAQNSGLQLNLLVNYSGRWDIQHALEKIVRQFQQNILSPAEINVETIEQQLATAALPEPDLFIRTSGECRLSNFMLWQLAYTELYFTQTLWPDFRAEDFDQAIAAFNQRQRRFGYTGTQLQTQENSDLC